MKLIILLGLLIILSISVPSAFANHPDLDSVVTMNNVYKYDPNTTNVLVSYSFENVPSDGICTVRISTALFDGEGRRTNHPNKIQINDDYWNTKFPNATPLNDSRWIIDCKGSFSTNLIEYEKLFGMGEFKTYLNWDAVKKNRPDNLQNFDTRVTPINHHNLFYYQHIHDAIVYYQHSLLAESGDDPCSYDVGVKQFSDKWIYCYKSDVGIYLPTVFENPPEPPTPQKKSGGGNKAIPPTMGLNDNDFRVVENGFIFNGFPSNVEKWHTDYPEINTVTGKTNILQMKIYEDKGVNNIMWTQIGWGVSEIGDAVNESEGVATIYFERNSIDVQKIEWNDPNDLINHNYITTSTVLVKCSESDDKESCVLFTMIYQYNDIPLHSMILIQVTDYDRSSNTYYFNEGISVSGQSQNEPVTKQILSEIKYKGLQTIQRIHKVNDIWITLEKDEPVVLYQQTSPGMFSPYEFRFFEKDSDELKTVINHNHSEFYKIKEYATNKALAVFDATIYESELIIPQPLDFSKHEDYFGVKKIGRTSVNFDDVLKQENDRLTKLMLELHGNFTNFND